MSGESALHAMLVDRLIGVVRNRHSCRRGLNLFADHQSTTGSRPWSIRGFTPDVIAGDLPETFQVLGEAKTPGDLESERSLRQLSAFIGHLSDHPCGFLYVAVPILYSGRAEAVIGSLAGARRASLTMKVLGIA